MIETKETMAQEALRLLTDVTADKWLMGAFTDERNGLACSITHYNMLKNGLSIAEHASLNVTGGKDGNALHDLAMEFNREYQGFPLGMCAINNGHNSYYNQATPKERVLACLKDMVEAGY